MICPRCAYVAKASLVLDMKTRSLFLIPDINILIVRVAYLRGKVTAAVLLLAVKNFVVTVVIKKHIRSSDTLASVVGVPAACAGVAHRMRRSLDAEVTFTQLQREMVELRNVTHFKL